jgi:hypothetical protein
LCFEPTTSGVRADRALQGKARQMVPFKYFQWGPLN